MASYEENANSIGDVWFSLDAGGDSTGWTQSGPFADTRGFQNLRYFEDEDGLSDLNGVSGITMTGWLNVANVVGNKCVCRMQFNSSTAAFVIRIDTNDVLIGGRSQSGDTFQSTTINSVITASAWHFFGLSVDYANGELIYRIDSTTGSPSATFGSTTAVFSSMQIMTIGIDEDLTNEKFEGGLAGLKIFNKALTAANLTTLYNSTSGYPAITNPATTPDSTKVLTWNPDSNSSNISYTNSNLTANYDAVSGNVFYFAKFTQAYAKSFIYFEVSASDPSPDSISFIVGVTTTKASQSWIGNGSDDVAINTGRALYVGGSSQGTDTNLPVFAYNTHRVCVAVDIAAEKVWIGYVNISTGVAVYHGGGNPATNTTPSYTNTNWGNGGEEFVLPAVTPYGVGNALTIHYAESDFVGAVPSGFYSLQYAAAAGGGAARALITGAL